MISRAYSRVWIAVFLLLYLFARLLSGARQLPQTADEPLHIAAGYAFVACGREAFWILPEYRTPPLLPAMEAVLLYAEVPDIPLERLAGWSQDLYPFADDLVSRLPPIERVNLVARMPVILLTVLLGGMVFRWGREMLGDAAGMFALAALVFDPILLGHGRLATTDVGVVAFGTGALYFLWRWTRSPSWLLALPMGACLGLALLSKQSGVIWLVSCIGVGSAVAVARRRGLSLLGQMILIGISSLVLLWAGHGFTWGPVRGLPFHLPAPDFWNGLLLQPASAGERLVFALGHRAVGGWWWYFPLAFVIKNPLPLLIALIIGLLTWLRDRPSRIDLLVIGVFPLLYACAAVAAGMNIGYRHMIPVHPALYLVIGGGLSRWVRRPPYLPWRGWALFALSAWYGVSSAVVYPYEIAYFSELIGGPRAGYRYLSDSNVDWGQAADVARAYARAHPDVRTLPPGTRFHPAAGEYLIGASPLQGIGIGEPTAYEWFRHRAPEEMLAYSLLVYSVPDVSIRWVAQCQVPAAPLDDAALGAGLGEPDVRSVRFDCTQAWLFPGGDSWGLYVLHHALLETSWRIPPDPLSENLVILDPFVARQLSVASGRLSFEQPVDAAVPAFALYEAQALGDASPVPVSPVYAAPAGTPIEDLGDLSNGPVKLGGTLTFLGITSDFAGDRQEVATWWRVRASSIRRPFSIMAHLVSADGGVVAVGDGLGVSPLELVAGDVLVQRHLFPAAAGQHWLETGAYWLDTMERWPVDGMAGCDSLFVPLP